MVIDPKTQLFHDLTPEDIESMTSWAEDLIVWLILQEPAPFWVEDWLQTFGSNPFWGSSPQTTVLPQKVLLSVVLAQRGRKAVQTVGVGAP